MSQRSCRTKSHPGSKGCYCSTADHYMHFFSSSDDVNAQVVMHTKYTEKNGQKYIYFSSMTTKLGIKDYEAKFKSNDGADSPISTAINQALDGGRQEILELIRPTLEKAISEKILELGNKVCKKFTYDELFPETIG